jgi:hypothetical protein
VLKQRGQSPSVPQKRAPAEAGAQQEAPREKLTISGDELEPMPMRGRHTMLSLCHSFLADTGLYEIESLGSDAAVADFGPIKHSSG